MKTLSLTENFDFAPGSGPIDARKFFKIQARTRLEPDPIRKARAHLTTMDIRTIKSDDFKVNVRRIKIDRCFLSQYLGVVVHERLSWKRRIKY